MVVNEYKSVNQSLNLERDDIYILFLPLLIYAEPVRRTDFTASLTNYMLMLY